MSGELRVVRVRSIIPDELIERCRAADEAMRAELEEFLTPEALALFDRIEAEWTRAVLGL